MGAGVPDGKFITAPVPAEMRPAEGLEDGVVAQPTADGGVRVTFPRPDRIPAPLAHIAAENGRVAMPLPDAAFRYELPLAPGVQCTIAITGEVKALHLKTLGAIIELTRKGLEESEANDGKKQARGRKADPAAEEAGGMT